MNQTGDPLAYFRHVVLHSLSAMLLLSLLAAAVAYVVTDAMGTTYEVHFSYVVSLSEREPSREFRFDGYYALQATDLFTSTVAEWTQTPEIVVRAMAAAGIAPQGYSSRSLKSLVTAEKAAPQLVHVVVRANDEQSAKKMAQALVNAVMKQVEDYHEKGIPALRFRVVSSEPWVGVSEPATAVIVGATFVFAFFFSLNVRLVWASLHRVV